MVALIPRNRYLRVRMQRRLTKVSWGLYPYKFTAIDILTLQVCDGDGPQLHTILCGTSSYRLRREV